MVADTPILDVRDLAVHFSSPEGVVRAVDGVTLHVHRGETVALVGESGCGKSVSSLALMRLAAGPGMQLRGRVVLEGESLLELPEAELRKRRGSKLAYVFQDPSTCLNPVRRVGDQIGEAVRLHRDVPDVEGEVVRLMGLVGLPEPALRQRDYPHQFSGGMQQRVMIAMALACSPRLLVADEPTTALDVTVQAQIFDLLESLRGRLGMSVLLITHNLGLVARSADRLYVMYAGQVVESGPVEPILRASRHPYTRGLLAAVPRMASAMGRMTGIEGTVPHPARLPQGCRFHPRCAFAQPICREREPALEPAGKGHESRCHFWMQMR